MLLRAGYRLTKSEPLTVEEKNIYRNRVIAFPKYSHERANELTTVIAADPRVIRSVVSKNANPNGIPIPPELDVNMDVIGSLAYEDGKGKNKCAKTPAPK